MKAQDLRNRLELLLFLIFGSILLAACIGKSGPSGPPGPIGPPGPAGKMEIPDSLTGPGVFPDNYINRDILHTGSRGCTSCHEELFSKVRDLGPKIHMTGEVTYNKPDDVKYCIGCHRAGYPLAGPKFGPIIHAVHYYDTSFRNKYNGNCFSCHDVDLNGKMMLWDEVKYEPEVFGYFKPNSDGTISWNKARGFPTGHQTGFHMDPAMQGTIFFSQETLTELDDVFTVYNYGMPEKIDPGTYELTVEGMVNTEKTYSLSDLQGMRQKEVMATLSCWANPVGGTWIANLKWSGVSLKTLLEETGVKPGANAVMLTGYDNWVMPIPLNTAMHPETILAMKINNQVLSNELGFPVKLVPHNRPGGFWINQPKKIEVTELPADHFWLQKMDMMMDIMIGQLDSFSMAEQSGSTMTAEQSGQTWINSGFLKPPTDGTEVRAGTSARLEGWAFAFEYPLEKVLFSGDYGKTWQAFDIPQPTDEHRWVYWKFDWTPPGPGTYLLKVKAQTKDGRMQRTPDNLILVAK